MLKNILKENIRPSSVDLRIGEIFELSKEKVVDLEESKLPKHKELRLPHILKPGEYILARTIEEISQPHKKYACLLSARSRAFRIGLSVQTNFFGPYYEGQIVFGILNVSKSPVKIFQGMSVVQMAFFDVKGRTLPISHDFQGGKII